MNALTSRTARGQQNGAALTFVTPAEEELLTEIQKRLKGDSQETPSTTSEMPIKPYKFQMSEIEGFRYRVKVSIGKQSLKNK